MDMWIKTNFLFNPVRDVIPLPASPSASYVINSMILTLLGGIQPQRLNII
ncbi:hypothetical protein PC1_0852 [Pectobacterium carotovorum subsp. carotovorum PC1]|uniref:Uncharacterized protein n=1 Tax=Pectobacterium carotovorum subsp. carotovorum (strain PC1) TaxID=561230 RepID=C6DA95_PECCP|nr:hypothetical protein PC1_0852 [Pectobacterium carotovorum subsp. carotovorum PC1]